MQLVVKIVLLTSALVVGCWARDYPIPKTRALVDTLTAACYDQVVAREIHYDIIQEALNELLAIPREARDQLGTSQEGQLLLDFVIMPVDTHSVALESDEEKEEYTRQAVDNFITFRPAYVERKLLDGNFPMPSAPMTQHFRDVIAESDRLTLENFRGLKAEIDEIWTSLNILRQDKNLNFHLDRVKGIWNYFNDPFIIVVGDYVLPFIELDDVELKLYRLMRWVFNKQSRRTTDGASSSSSRAVGDGQVIYHTDGIPADSATKRLVDMVNDARQPTQSDLVAAENEIKQWSEQRTLLSREIYQGHDSIGFAAIYSLSNHPTVAFLRHKALPLMYRNWVGSKLSRLLKYLLDLEDRSLPTAFGN